MGMDVSGSYSCLFIIKLIVHMNISEKEPLKVCSKAGERAQNVNALASLPDDPGLVLSTHVAAHKHL